MAETAPRLGKMDALVVRIVKDIILMMDDDPYLDLFEELLPASALPVDDEGDLSDEADEVWQRELDLIECRVLKRVAGALTHYAGDDKTDRLVRELHRQLKAEDDTAEPDPPHTILVYTGQAPAAHLVRQN